MRTTPTTRMLQWRFAKNGVSRMTRTCSHRWDISTAITTNTNPASPPQNNSNHTRHCDRNTPIVSWEALTLTTVPHLLRPIPLSHLSQQSSQQQYQQQQQPQQHLSGKPFHLQQTRLVRLQEEEK